MMERKAKTHKGRLIKEKKQPKIIEGEWLILLARGLKTSESVLTVLKTLVN